MDKISPKVSIIIPVYNVAGYLRQCIGSIANQTLKEIEIICVNDGSTDDSPQILEEFVKKDERIKYISRENKGISASRNDGLDHAAAEYVMLIDADDYLEPDMVETMYNAMLEHKPDVVVCDVDNIIDDTVTDPEKIKEFSNSQNWFNRYSRPDGLYDIGKNIKEEFASVVWNKLYKADIIRQYNVFFPDGDQEDEYFLWAYMIHCRSVWHIQKKLYHYVRHTGSVMDVIYDSERALSVFEQYKRVYNYIKQYKCIVPYKYLLAKHYIGTAEDRLYHVAASMYPAILEKVRDYTFNCNPSEMMLEYYLKLKKQITTQG